MRHNLFLAGLALALLIAPTAGRAESTQAFGGFSFSPNAWYGYAGASTAINGDLYKDGVVARASIGGGQYDYSTVAVTGGKVDADVVAVDIMGGYQKYFSLGYGQKVSRGTLYAGADYQNHSLSPSDSSARVKGGEYGFKTLAELNLNVTDQISAQLIGSYSTGFNTYWSRERVGYDIGFGTVGPEFTFLGNKSFDQRRFGAYIGEVSVVKNVKASASVGYSDSLRRGKDGAYGEISATYDF